MKRILFTVIAIAGSAAAFSQVPKIPLIEHFTQASCGPCASQNPTLKSNLDAFGTANYVRISHQVSWPGVDPMNAAFPAGPDVRRNYYGITGVPNTSLNGGTPGSSVSVVTSSTLATAGALTTPYDITVTQSWPDANSVTVDIDIDNVTGSAISDADKVYITMLEKQVVYSSPPGSNGETSFEYVMRQIYTTTGTANATAGSALGTIAGGGTQNYNFTISSLPNYLADKNEVIFAVYIQKNSSKVIYQAGKSSYVVIPGIVSVEAQSNSVANSGLCDYAFTPVIDFTNNDASTNVTQVVAEYSIDAGTPVQQTFNGNLTNGQSTSITFPATTLNPGSTIVSYEIISVNGGQAWSSPMAVSMEDETFVKVSASGVAAPIFEGFESSVLESGTGYSREITTGFFEVGAEVAINNFGVVDGPAYSYGAHGGFGNSDRLIRSRLFSIAPGTVMSLTMDKINLGTGSELTFNHAYRQYSNENDQLEVLVSDDCGASWTSVFDEAGSTLATLAADQNSYNTPGSGDWRANTVDLSAFDGTNDVIVKFEITSAYGNNMFIDDINIGESGTSPGASIEEDDKVSFSVFPNPATDEFVVSLGQDIDSEIQILDIQGKVVSAQVVSAGQSNITINSANLDAGVYTVLVKTENGVTAQKVMIK